MELFLRKCEHSVKFVAALAAALFALTQYYGHLKEERVKQTLEFQKRYSSDPLYSTRLYVNQKWEENWPNFAGKFQKPKTKAEEEDQRKQWEKEVIAFVTKNKLAIKTNELIDYFGALQVCIENDICDKKSAIGLLQTSATELLQNNCAYIAHIKYDRKDSDYANKALLFSDGACNPDMYK